MRWAAISGSWRRTNIEVEKDVRSKVREKMLDGLGIVSGGALGVDYFAADEALKLDPTAERIKIFLPTTLETYSEHYFKRAKQRIITCEQYFKLISQLEVIVGGNSGAIVEIPENKEVNKRTYYQRIRKEIDFADELAAFQVNNTEGTGYTIDLALKKGIPVEIFKYKIPVIKIKAQK